MTTIVYRDGVLAADTAIFDRGCYCGPTIKAYRAPSGVVGAAAGSLVDCLMFRDWLLGGQADPVPSFKSSDSEGIFINAPGQIMWLGNEQKLTHIMSEYIALGSGFRIAMGALAAGVTAERAVEICCDLDENTRRPVTVLHLEPKGE